MALLAVNGQNEIVSRTKHGEQLSQITEAFSSKEKRGATMSKLQLQREVLTFTEVSNVEV